MLRLRPAIAVLLAALLLPVHGASAAEFLDFYKTGLAARDAGDWQQVEKMMRRAIELKPEEKRRLLMRRGGYFPHFYLGLARYRQGDCTGAMAAWDESERQAAIVGKEEYLELSQMQADCRDNGKPSLVTSSAQPVSEPKAAGEPAESQESQESKSTGKETARKGQLLVEKGADPARRGLGAVERLALEDSDLGRAARQGQGAVELAEVGAEVVDMVLSPEDRLRAAIDAYFTGKPLRTLELLASADLSDPRGKSQVYLFRAAASFRLHRLAGSDETRLAAARKNAELFRAQPWRKDFPAELFDPEFVRFLKGGG